MLIIKTTELSENVKVMEINTGWGIYVLKVHLCEGPHSYVEIDLTYPDGRTLPLETLHVKEGTDVN